MSAAEMKFPDPPANQPSWLALAQAVFNRQAARWDMKHCGGGLRWQFNVLNNGYMDKNTISNGCFFQLAARLARYTGNQTYADWADKAYEWLTVTSPLVNADYEVYDSISFTDDHCNKPIGEVQWTYNIGTLIAGVAFMYNHTDGADIWRKRLEGYLANTQRVFFLPEYGGKTMVEYACEPGGNCNKDQRSFKAYLSRWLTVTMQLAPFTVPQIKPWIETSAQAAARACSNTPQGLACGRTWYKGIDDGDRDIGQQMTAMSIIQSNLIWQAPALADIKVGTSKSDPTAGSTSGITIPPDQILAKPIQTSDKAGAWIITLMAITITMVVRAILLFEKDDVRRYFGTLGGRS
jgi:mannan endo-1,6-alpha-mannosidase